jgi:hypothetical protein
MTAANYDKEASGSAAPAGRANAVEWNAKSRCVGRSGNLGRACMHVAFRSPAPPSSSSPDVKAELRALPLARPPNHSPTAVACLAVYGARRGRKPWGNRAFFPAHDRLQGLCPAPCTPPCAGAASPVPQSTPATCLELNWCRGLPVCLCACLRRGGGGGGEHKGSWHVPVVVIYSTNREPQDHVQDRDPFWRAASERSRPPDTAGIFLETSLGRILGRRVVKVLAKKRPHPPGFFLRLTRTPSPPSFSSPHPHRSTFGLQEHTASRFEACSTCTAASKSRLSCPPSTCFGRLPSPPGPPRLYRLRACPFATTWSTRRDLASVLSLANHNPASSHSPCALSCILCLARCSYRRHWQRGPNPSLSAEWVLVTKPARHASARAAIDLDRNAFWAFFPTYCLLLPRSPQPRLPTALKLHPQHMYKSRRERGANPLTSTTTTSSNPSLSREPPTTHPLIPHPAASTQILLPKLRPAADIMGSVSFAEDTKLPQDTPFAEEESSVFPYQDGPENKSWAGALPLKQGLYDPELEKDACGVGFAAYVPRTPFAYGACADSG